MMLSAYARCVARRQMANKPSENGWATVSYARARQVQMDIALRMTLRDRLEAMEELSNLALRLAAMSRRYAQAPLARAGRPQVAAIPRPLSRRK